MEQWQQETGWTIPENTIKARGLKSIYNTHFEIHAGLIATIKANAGNIEIIAFPSPHENALNTIYYFLNGKKPDLLNYGY